MAKRMEYSYNRTLDKLLLTASHLIKGKMQLASEALDNLLEDEDGTLESDIDALDELNQAAMEDAEGEPHLEDADEVEEAEFADDSDEDDLEDLDVEDDAVAKVSARLKGGHKRKAQTAKVVDAKAAQTARARKVIANLAKLRKARR